MSGVLIIGAGQAGFQIAASLRSEGYAGEVRLVGEEPWLPYQRPPLSKAFLAGKQDIEATALRPESFYEAQSINLLMGERVAAIDRGRKMATLESGGDLSYDALVLATGARNRMLRIKGAELEGVHYLRSRDEAVELAARLESAHSVAIIGGGFIGLEVAATATGLGKRVTVVEAQQRLMMRSVAPIMSNFFFELHTAHGVRIMLNATLSEITSKQGRVDAVVLNDGTVLPADVVVVGIGVVPKVELAADAGLEVANGIAVDQYLRTSDDSIFAIGDCADYPNRFAGGRARLESVQNAVDQARCVAAGIAGKPRVYDAVPWFWTDQFDIKLQMVGIAQGCDVAVGRSAIESRKFSVCYFKEGRLAAIDSVNRPGDHIAGRKLIAEGSWLTAEQAADESVDLKAAHLVAASQRL